MFCIVISARVHLQVLKKSQKNLLRTLSPFHTHRRVNSSVNCQPTSCFVPYHTASYCLAIVSYRGVTSHLLASRHISRCVVDTVVPGRFISTFPFWLPLLNWKKNLTSPTANFNPDFMPELTSLESFFLHLMRENVQSGISACGVDWSLVSASLIRTVKLIPFCTICNDDCRDKETPIVTPSFAWHLGQSASVLYILSTGVSRCLWWSAATRWMHVCVCYAKCTVWKLRFRSVFIVIPVSCQIHNVVIFGVLVLNHICTLLWYVTIRGRAYHELRPAPLWCFGAILARTLNILYYLLTYQDLIGSC